MSWPHPPPPPGPPLAPHRPAPSPALAIVGLCTGIASLALVAVLGPFAAVLGAAGVTTGGIALARRLPGRGMALAGVITGAVGTVVAVVLTVVVVGTYGAVFLATVLSSSGGDDAPDPQEARSAGEHVFGETVQLDEYAVSVDGVSARGDVVYADLTVRFTGRGTGDSYEDLYGYLSDADGYEYDATDCTRALSPDAAQLPDLAPGETATFQMCFEGVQDAAGARVEVDDAAQWTYAGWTDPADLPGSGGGSVGV